MVILLVCWVVVGEAACRSQKARRQQNELAAGRLVGTRGPAEPLLDDALDALDVDEVESEGATTGLVDRVPPVLVAKPQELLRLPELGPGKIAGEQQAHEATDVSAALLGLANHPVRVAHGVGRELLRVIVVVGGPPARWLSLVGLDQLSIDVDPYQPAVAAHRRGLADVAGRHRVERLAEADVVVAVDDRFTPLGCVEAVTLQR